MIDNVYHMVQRMNQPARNRRTSPRARQTGLAVSEDADLRALLDHLGRLLAQEYVERLRGATSDEAELPKRKKR
jgi:hypothetical protein